MRCKSPTGIAELWKIPAPVPKLHTTAFLVSYGVHAIFTRAGNVVACRYCRHADAAATRCTYYDQTTTPDSRCFAKFEREVGTDDDAA